MTISNGYTLALASDVAKTSTTAEGFSGLTYKSASNTAGYTLADNKVTYTSAKAAEDLFTLTGVANIDGIKVDGQSVTLNATNLNGNSVSISGGDYTLSLAEDVDTTAEDLSGWTTLDGGNVAYPEDGTGSYYSLSDDGKTVTYNELAAGTNKVELSGVRGELSLGDGIVSLKADNMSDAVSIVSNAGGYQFAFSGNLTGKTFTGTEGNDSLLNSGSNMSLVGDGSITLVGAVSLEAVNIAGELIDTQPVSNTETFDNTSAVKVTLRANTEIADASKRTKAIIIVGNALDNSITGNSKNDQLLDANGNERTMLGGTIGLSLTDKSSDEVCDARRLLAHESHLTHRQCFGQYPRGRRGQQHNHCRRRRQRYALGRRGL